MLTTHFEDWVIELFVCGSHQLFRVCEYYEKDVYIY